MCPVIYNSAIGYLAAKKLFYILTWLTCFSVYCYLNKRNRLGLGSKLQLFLFSSGALYLGVKGGLLFQILVSYFSGELIDMRTHSYYGGVITVIALSIGYAYLKGISILLFLDVTAVAASLAGVWTRIGCFMHGCCRGDLAPGHLLAVRYPVEYSNLSPTLVELLCGRRWSEYLALSGPSPWVYPAPLYLAIGFYFIYRVLLSRQTSLYKYPGELFFLWLVLQSVLRLLVEMIRYQPPYLFGKINVVGGVTSIVALVIGISFLVVQRVQLRNGGGLEGVVC